MSRKLALVFACILLVVNASSQTAARIVVDQQDAEKRFYIAYPPASGKPKAAIVVLTNFSWLDNMIPQTRLHQVTYTNDLLTVYVPLQERLVADASVIADINLAVMDVLTRYKVDKSKVVLAGYDFATNIALRYTELANENPGSYPVQPAAVIGVTGAVSVEGIWNWAERVKRGNTRPGLQGDANFVMDYLAKNLGTLPAKAAAYKGVSPFNEKDTAAGNERWLYKTPVRLYYDTDISFYLADRGCSLYETWLPDASALINRLNMAGNAAAAFVSAAAPGKRNNGMRYPDAWSIVDEAEAVKWVKETLHIFDPMLWKPPYKLPVKDKWGMELFGLPPDFAASIPYTGVEDIRFSPGWGDTFHITHWTYAFLWWVEGMPAVTETTLNNSIQAYYEGLVTRNIEPRKIPGEKLVPTAASFHKIKTQQKDGATFQGTIKMLNYLRQVPITLNCLVHVRPLAAQQHTAIFFELSPLPLQHPVWQEMDSFWTGFEMVRE